MLDKLKNICNTLNIDFDTVLVIYRYGSFVYGMNGKSSDEDFILVIDDDNIKYETIVFGKIDVHTISKKEFYEGVTNGKILSWECILQNTQKSHVKPFYVKTGYIIPEIPKDVNKWALRKNVSAICNNSWVKCKKKLLRGDNVYIGVKSLFHSLRIMNYGIQIAEGRRDFFDFTSCNIFYTIIMSHYHDYITNNLTREELWDTLEKAFKLYQNTAMIYFRALCPKPKGE